MLRKLVNTSDDDTKINLSPMIDMVFILLIFFIVTTVFVEEIGVTVQSSSNSGGSLNDNPTTSILIIKDQVFIDDIPVQKQSLMNRIKGVAKDPDISFILDTRDGVKHELFPMYGRIA